MFHATCHTVFRHLWQQRHFSLMVAFMFFSNPTFFKRCNHHKHLSLYENFQYMFQQQQRARDIKVWANMLKELCDEIALHRLDKYSPFHDIAQHPGFNELERCSREDFQLAHAFWHAETHPKTLARRQRALNIIYHPFFYTLITPQLLMDIEIENIESLKYESTSHLRDLAEALVNISIHYEHIPTTPLLPALSPVSQETIPQKPKALMLSKTKKHKIAV